MRSHSFNTLLSLGSLLAASCLGSAAQANVDGDDDVVTLVTRVTITTCPIPPTPPPPCSSVSSSSASPVTTSSTLTTTATLTVRTSSTTTSALSSHGSSSSGSSVSESSTWYTNTATTASSTTSSLSISSEVSSSSTSSGYSTDVSSTSASHVSSSSTASNSYSTDVTSSVPSSSSWYDSSSTVTPTTSYASSSTSTCSDSSSTATPTTTSDVSSSTSIGSSSSSTSSSTTASTTSGDSSSTVTSSTSSVTSTSSDVSTSISSSSSSSSISTSSTSSGSSMVPSTTSTSTSASATSSASSSVSSTSSMASSTTSSSSSTTSSSVSSTITSSSSSSSTTSTSSSSTTSSSTSVSPPACTDHWLAKIEHQGYAPYVSSPSTYKVFRNVKDFGAKGDGVTDDTDAINRAISEGGRCSPGKCQGTTISPAVVYFPPGTYLVSSPIVDYYFTQIYGNPDCMPVIKASANFVGSWVLDANQYQAGGSLGWGSTNVFWRQVRNLVIDLTSVRASMNLAGIHWPSSQATSLQNILVKMSTASNTQHYGMLIEEGSGGYLGDMVFQGGLDGMRVGNQQFTMRNMTFIGAKTAIKQLWDWGWTYSGVSIRDCDVGLDISNVDGDKISTASIVFIDSEIVNTRVGILTARQASNSNNPNRGNTLVVENLRLSNVQVGIQGPNSETVLPGSAGSATVAGWAQGGVYFNKDGPGTIREQIAPAPRPAGLTAGTHFYERSRPQYANLPASQFISVRTAGAKGDGVTDDTAAINSAIALAAASGKVVYFDYGIYVVTSTVSIPAGSRITGEGLPVILSQGQFFNSMDSPKPVVQVGKPGDTGAPVEWSDMVVSTRGQQKGAILIEWNLASTAPSGMWDVHTRIGGFKGSNLQSAECPKTPDTKITPENLNQNCIAAFMSMHVTKSAANLYNENCWLWVADHDVEDGANNVQITIYAGRGLLVESTAGNIWLWGSGSEHHQLYQYQFVGTRSVFGGQLQSETAYYQPNPDAVIPFPADARYSDPVLASGESGWALRVVDSSDIFVYGAGLYSFFINNNNSCAQEASPTKCQTRLVSIERSKFLMYNLNTVGASKMITLDGTDVASFEDNRNGFVSTVGIYVSS